MAEHDDKLTLRFVCRYAFELTIDSTTGRSRTAGAWRYSNTKVFFYLTDLPLAREDDDALLCALVRAIDRVSDETAAALGSDVVHCMINPRILQIPTWNNESY